MLANQAGKCWRGWGECLQNRINSIFEISVYIQGFMRSAQQLQEEQFNIREEYDNIINRTIEMTKHMSYEQRFQKAKSHIMDALLNRDARNTADTTQLTTLYYVLYQLQSCAFWNWLVYLLSYAYMYLVILDNQSYGIKIIVEGIFLLIFLFDTFIDFYCKSFDKLKQKNRYPAFYFWKGLIVALMIIDLIIFMALPCYNSRPIRPLRILRAFLPVVFDDELRKCLRALVSAYKDIFVFIIYYTLIIIGFAFLGSRVINYDPTYVDPNYPNQPGGYDVYQSNFNDFGKMIMQIYTLGTYDNYPDDEAPSFQYAQANYVFYIVFIFLNMFLFVLVPGTIIYNKFRENRSKYILVDEIRQQHSLILAFVTLTQDQHNLSMQILIQFLFYFYRKKIRFVQYITEICLKLDDNNNQTIQVNEFMQLSKLILYNSILYPPSFDDIELWISFRRVINDKIHLKQIINHWIFQLVVSIYITLCCVNTLILLYKGFYITRVIDYIFIWLFVVEILLKMVGNGPEMFFSDRWNALDAFLIGINVIFFFVTIGNNVDNLFKINRIFRIAGVIKLVLQSKFITNKKIEIVEQLKRLFTTIIEIMPIIVRFFLLYAFLYYILGIFGMQIFYKSQFVQDKSNYNKYIQFSNFKTFIYSQYLLMQVLTEASWSTIVYDYCWRSPDYYAGIIILFILMHFILVTVVGTLIKGIFWEIYFTVSRTIDSINHKVNTQILKEEENQIKTIQINQINEQLNQNQSIAPNTIIKREIIEKKLDQQILKRIKNFEFYSDDDACLSDRSKRSISRSKIAEQIMQNWKISANELQIATKRKRKNSITSPKFISPKIKKKRAFEFRDLQSKEEYDFQEEIEQLLNKLILSNKIKYSEIIAYPKMLVEFLNFKFKHPEEYINADKFDLNLNPLYNDESINFHVYELHSILGIQSSMDDKKQMILEILTKNNIITERQGEKIFNNQLIIKKFHIDTHGALRKMYLSETNEDLVRKLQVQYFSDVYGNSFKQINKVTLQPLIKVEASLTYILWNILSYPQIDTDDFFHFITHIEDQMSNKLLKKGSLVKFVYKINHESDIWFQVEHKLHQQTQIRFIKTGVWAYTEQMSDNKIYYARDIFNWDRDQEASQNYSQFGQQYMKLLYQSFETLGFSLIDKQSFFESNAKEYIYDLYLENFNIQSSHRRSCSNNLSISNIMMVILSKQEERIDIGEKKLAYNVSQIKTMRKKVKKQDFILDQTDKETFQKLKNLSAMNHQKIIESQGLPFSYIFNLMKQIEDILKLYSNNFVRHIQKALNSKYNSIDNTSLNDEDDIISLPEIVVNLDS